MEEFNPAILKMLGMTLLVPNVIAGVASAVPSAASALSPLNTLNQLVLAYYGMSNRQAMRRKFNIRGGERNRPDQDLSLSIVFFVLPVSAQHAPPRGGCPLPLAQPHAPRLTSHVFLGFLLPG